MIDDDRTRDARPQRDAREQHGARPHHMVESDGELLDIGPDAETVDDVDTQAHERRGVRWPLRGRRASDREPDSGRR
jgi:hypothetical protein